MLTTHHMQQNRFIPSLEFTDALGESMSKPMQFSGRSRRSEYWWTMLAICVVESFAVPFVFIFFPTRFIVTPIIFLLFEFSKVPLTFRRLHDTGRSGWWYGTFLLLPVLFLMLILFQSCYSCVADAVYGAAVSMHAHDSLHSSLSNGSVFITVTVGILLFYIVAPVYTIVLLVMLCQDSQPFCNRYGPSPKYIEQEEMRQ